MRSTVLCAALFAVRAVAQEPSCRLEGRVFDPLQQPVTNAEVTAAVDGEVVARTRTDGDGAFVFGRLPPRAVTVRATGETPLVGAAWLDLLGLDRQFATLTAVPTRTVRGTVCDAEGRPVPGAWLVSAPRIDSVLAVASAMVQADDGGRFVLSHVPYGLNFVRAWAPGLACDQQEFRGRDDLELAFTLDEAREERRFALTGAPAGCVATARLRIAASHGGRPLPLPPPLRLLGSTDGMFRVLGWPVADALTASLLLPEGAAMPCAIEVPADCSGGVQQFTFVAAPPQVRGRLSGGELPAGTWLVAEPLDGPGRRSFGQVDHDGRFALPAPAAPGQRFALRVLHPDWRCAPRAGEAKGVWWYDTVDPEHERELALAPARRVLVRVQRHDRTPAAGAAVRLIREDAWQVHGNDLPLPEVVPSVAAGCTGNDGTLELTGLDLADDVALHCVVEGLDGFALHTFRPGAEPRITLHPLLQRGATLEVQLVGDATHPAAGATTHLMPYGVGMACAWTLVCDRNGRARRTGLPEGAYRVTALGNEQDVDLVDGVARSVELRPRGN